MESQIRRLDEVKTSDGKLLGLGQRIFRRSEGADPAQLLYERYLEVENYDLGTAFFIPVEFIETEGAVQGELVLSTSFKEVQERTWFRMPTFIARGQAVEEPLPER